MCFTGLLQPAASVQECAARSFSTGVCCGEMVSSRTTASQGILCLSVYGLVYGTFAMSAVVPVVWLPWTGFALQPPFALCFRLLLLYPARLWIRGAWDQTVPPSSRCALFHAPGWPTPRKGLYRHQNYWLPIFGRRGFVLDFLVLIGVVQTVLTMPPALAAGWAHLAERYSRCRDGSYLRDATESIAKTTKHLHTGHQTTSVNTYLSCAT